MAALGDQLLDQLGARGLVLDRHHARIEQALLLAHGAFERRVFEASAVTPRRKRSLSLVPQVVHTEKSLSSVALLAVSRGNALDLDRPQIAVLEEFADQPAVA
jgi:hypothetical protein